MERLLNEYLAAQLSSNRRQAIKIVLDDGLAQGIPVTDLYLGIIQAAQYRIGELWQENRISVAQEHLATAVSQIVVAELYRAAVPAPSNGYRALVTCVSGELHELGTRITADFFELAGFDVRYLGANVPTDALVAMAREEQPDLLVASVTMSSHLEALADAVDRTRAAVGDKLRLAVGGYALSSAPRLVERLTPDIYGRDADASVAAARHLFDVP
jgi:methanogenic corrinoid protein MtbC1